MFKSTSNKGFQLTFENGLTISVQFGTGNYCHRNRIAPVGEEMKQDIIESETAEIAIWDKTGQWYNFGSDEVKGWASPDEVAEWIHLVKEAHDIENLKEIAIGSPDLKHYI